MIELPIGTKTHHLAFVKWHLPAPNQQTRFYCKTNNGRDACNIELWKYEYYETGRDSIIPIHTSGNLIRCKVTKNLRLVSFTQVYGVNLRRACKFYASLRCKLTTSL